MKNILIVGGGSGGTTCANQLIKKIKPRFRKDTIITVIDKSELHIFQPDQLHVAFNGMNPAKLSKMETSLLLPNIKFVNDSVSKIDLKNQVVRTLATGDLKYDYIIIALGSMPDYDAIPGLRQSNLDFHTSPQASAQIYSRLNKMQGGKFVVGVAGFPYKCPPSPNEAAFLLHDYLVKRGIRDKSGITFITPLTRFYSLEPVSNITEPIARKKNIDIKTVFNIDHIDPEAKKIISLEGKELEFDGLFLVPPHKPPDLLKGEEFADKDGWIKVNKNDLSIEGYDNAFAIGDVTNAPTAKTGVTAHLEAACVSSNIADKINNIAKVCSFTGRTHCPFEVGGNKAVFVIATYDKPARRVMPSFENYMLKKIMSKIYWGTLKGKYDDIFKIYFGEDYPGR